MVRLGLREYKIDSHLVHPRDTFAARGALSAAFVLVEFNETCDAADQVRLLVDDNDSSGSKTRLDVAKGIKVRKNRLTNVLGQKRDGRAAGNDGLRAACV